ncbi:unnamed protein product [Ambrosiozyma monospora]|uniref:Unnamed protein product n=1 Tax=Ambrosiozyma monospora TaxID=43982 RepID=A0ACB5TCS6_AMBMO|nr:unnamed protein product [Ambrosiozyma monospora]
MDLLSGTIHMPCLKPRDQLQIDPQTGLTDSVAYCDQTPWLLNATIRDNILFASPFNRQRYNSVISACGLTRDLAILGAGDQTEIGEKGITLSGGQKQRVSLARALYSNSKFVLLDDCLSAVDSQTAVHVYENAVCGELMAGRTVVLVSHNVALCLKKAGFVVVMENGRVKCQGTVEELVAKKEIDEEVVASLNATGDSSSSLSSFHSKSAGAHNESTDVASDGDDEDAVNKGKLMEEETKREGAVSWNVYKSYFKYFGDTSTFTILVVSLIGAELVFVLQSWWLRVWSVTEYQRLDYSTTLTASSSAILAQAGGIHWFKPVFDTPIAAFFFEEEHSTIFYVTVYSLIGLAYSLMSSIRVLYAYFAGLDASKSMFEVLLWKVLGANLRFFDSTPVGRIMNRFSKDIEQVDELLAPYAEAFLTNSVSCISIICVISVITPAFILFAIFIGIVYYCVGVLYLNLSRDLKRYESISRSPIVQHFTETLAGITTIRAYGDERRFLIGNMKRVDECNRPYFYVELNARWLSFRTNLIGAMIIFLSSALAVAYSDKIDSGLAGISLSFAISFNQNAVFLLNNYSNVEINMNSVERIEEYVEEIPQEPPAVIPETEPKS